MKFEEEKGKDVKDLKKKSTLKIEPKTSLKDNRKSVTDDLRALLRGMDSEDKKDGDEKLESIIIFKNVITVEDLQINLTETNYESKENIERNLKGRHTRISILKNLSQEDLEKLKNAQDEEYEQENKENDLKKLEDTGPKVKRLINHSKLLTKNWPFNLETYVKY